MPDMLVKLYALPSPGGLEARLRRSGVATRRPLAPEKHLVVGWVRRNFGAGWADECETAFARQPVSCFIALKRGGILGFACHDATMRNFFGPAGTLRRARGRGIGRLLLLKCLYAMRQQGYAYAVIGGAGPREFYSRSAGAVEIEGSEPGIYAGLLKARPPRKARRRA